MTCHDRDFMNRVVDRLVEIDEGELVEYGGNYDFYDRERAVRAREQRPRTRASRRCSRRKSASSSASSGTWPRPRRCSRASRSSTRSRSSSRRRRRELVPFEFRTPPRSGNDVVTLQSISKRYGERVIYDGFDFEIKRGERWCVMGVNGAGKTTLLKMVAGVTKPDSGRGQARGEPEDGLFRAVRARDPGSRRSPCTSRSTTPSRSRRRRRSAACSAPSTSPATRSTSASRCSPAASAHASCWRRCCSTRRTSSCSTSRPTTSTSTPRRCWSRRSPTSTARCSS
jgi:ATPase subunit of ABC transporter with duplicated ATPase domains